MISFWAIVVFGDEPFNVIDVVDNVTPPAPDDINVTVAPTRIATEAFVGIVTVT